MARSSSPPVIGYLRHGPLPPATVAALRDALGQHSPTIEPDPPEGCWLDLRGGKRAPDPQVQAWAIAATAREWGCPSPRVGVAPTPGVARLAASLGTGEATILDHEQTPTFLAPLAVADTGVDDDTATRLALVGLRTLGDLAALPRGALGDYLGPLGPALEALARGEDARPLAPARPPLVLTARRDLDWALNDRAALATLVAQLLDPLLAHLRHLGLGATRASVRLTCEDSPAATTVRLRAPTTDRDAVLGPLLTALAGTMAATMKAAEEGHETTTEGITAVAVTVAAPRPLASIQASFFDVPQGRRALLAEGLVEGRRRGQGRLGYLAPLDPAHPDPDRRYGLVEGPVPPVGEAAS